MYCGYKAYVIKLYNFKVTNKNEQRKTNLE